DVCVAFENLIRTIVAEEDFEEAETFCKRLIATRSKQLGSRHIEVAVVLSHLADVYRQQEKFEDAALIYKQAIEVHTLARGREGLSLVHMLENYAATLRSMGEKVKAAKMETRAKSILEYSR
ncbi:MAG: tetratricopeptide repeat protein, partial [Cyanobacteria bacterium]|nr:tetratricopeptide repeat protein [Cyanobacteriota bacterium]